MKTILDEIAEVEAWIDREQAEQVALLDEHKKTKPACARRCRELLKRIQHGAVLLAQARKHAAIWRVTACRHND